MNHRFVRARALFASRPLSWGASVARALLMVAGGASLSATAALQGQVIASGLSQPVFATAPLGDDRLFFLEKSGTVRVWSGGALLATPFLDLSAQVNSAGERGLLGLAFDPDYARNGRFYVNYIDSSTLATVVERYTVASPASNQAPATSAERILTIPQEPYTNHKAGWIGFRPGEGSHLYVTTGDGGWFNDPNHNAQNTDSLLGKILRVDVSGAGPGYAIPAGNPYVGMPGRDEIWASGLRNPWRNSFDRATGDFWIADVGQGAREEIDFEAAGAPDAAGRNYGWRLREGTVATPGVGGPLPGATEPVFDYGRPGEPGGLGGSIVGGYVYRGPSLPEADGRYFFADYISGRVFSFLPAADGAPTDLRDETEALLAGTGLDSIASFGEDGAGRLLIVGLNGIVVSMVPEPAAWAALLAGLPVLMAAVVRRRGLRAGG